MRVSVKMLLINI